MSETVDPDISNKKIREMQSVERKHKDRRLDEFITRGEMEGWAGMVHERSDIAFRAVRVLLRTLLRKNILLESDLSDEEKLIKEEVDKIQKDKTLCPYEFEMKNDTNLCKMCKAQCPFLKETIKKSAHEIDLKFTPRDK